ncbi:hypothetical protein SISSUDRAFT_1042912 [Sistotremastrum suecicum HHB10207 ss-3]|uniref:Uncharacterized protein n=1 Tax=Sistotremastrum suecicum HHB10207 ss-3 TaxID=1314776 RepID=A0A166G5M1_9AGAM|nr:hypothetical protein SISSUDRAFT_1042912 [Sistotremastrum suecicum HHB10207 ss-3]
MFDDYVEHSEPAHNRERTNAQLAQLGFQGFEPPPFGNAVDTRPDANAELLTPLERGFSAGATSSAPALFDLGRVQYDMPAPLRSLVVSSDIVAMGLASNMILMLELKEAEQITRIQIPKKPQETTIYKLFLDPSGRHLLVSTLQGEVWYIFKGWKKAKRLKGFNMIIESVAWNRQGLMSSLSSTSTKEFLIGARDGIIYEACVDAEDDFFRGQERFLQDVYTIPERPPITGIKFEYFPPSDAKKCLIIATTPSRIYQFTGTPNRRSDEVGRVFHAIFSKYRESVPKILELPGDIKYSELQFWLSRPNQAQSLPKSMAWLTAPGIYHGTLNFTSGVDDFIDGAQLMPFPTLSPTDDTPPQSPTTTPVPLSIAVTEFHFILLYYDRVVAVSRLDERVTHEELLPLKLGEEVRGLTTDLVGKTYWVYTDRSLFEFRVLNEDRDVWSAYLEKGMHSQALHYAKSLRQRDLVLASQANAFFLEGRYIQSAQSYAQSSTPFEEVVLRFLDAKERDALRYYLVARLERTKKTDLIQRMMLATWLVEFYLSKCNELDDLVASESLTQDVDNLRAERSLLEDELKQFFETYKANLDRTTVYELIQGHGRTDVFLDFATIVGDHERVVEHWVLEEKWLQAIDVLNRQNNLELYYRFAPVLIINSPKETVECWMKQPALDPIRLIPALLRLQRAPRNPLSPNYAIRFLTHVIFETGNISPTIHNLLATLYASSQSTDDGPFLRFLSTAPSDPFTGKPYYDLDYTLRLCKKYGRLQPCVHIYSKMGLWENSVDLALEKGDVELAKLNADKPEDDQPLRKKLWLKIAKYVVQDKQDIKTAIQFLENTDLIKIEDILPFFPDFVVIDDFKEEICNALEGYSNHIETLKAEMDEATRSAEAIKEDIANLKNRFVTLDINERCTKCSYPLFSRQFYVFPCQHAFHADCLIGIVKEYLPAPTLRRMLALQTELMRATAKPSNERQGSVDGTNGSVRGGRSLLSANFVPNGRTVVNAAGTLGRGMLSAGDKLRDLIVPESLASVVGGWGGDKKTDHTKDSKRVVKLREELDDLLASSCPLCESAVLGLDKPFLAQGETDSSWQI